MNDLLVSLALMISFIGFVGLVKRLEPLNRNRWAGAGLLAVGLALAVAAGTRSDDGSEPGDRHMLLDDFMPEYDFNEIHAIRISAPPYRVYHAMKAVSLHDVGVANVLFWIRSLPGRLSGRPSSAEDEAANPLFRTGDITETRILATDAIARRKFARYWTFIQPGSAILRRTVLKAIKRNAEQETQL